MIAVRKCLPLLAIPVLIVGCRGEEPAAKQPDVADTKLPVLPAVEPPLDRRGLLLAVADVASLHAAGRDETALQQSLKGRRFEVRLRFGCAASAPEGRGWTFDPEERVLRVQAVPDISMNDELVHRLSGEEIEGVEGFWLQRPWLLDAACPSASTVVPDASPPSSEEEKNLSASELPRIGMAQFYTIEDSRAHRRDDRPFSATVRLQAGENPSTDGYDLVLSGRLTPMPDGPVIACDNTSMDQAPSCIVSAEFETISLAPAAGEVIAQWSPG